MSCSACRVPCRLLVVCLQPHIAHTPRVQEAHAMNADSSSSSPTPSSPRLPHSSHALQNCDSSLYSEPSFGHSIDKNVPSRLSKLRRLQAAELPVAAQRLDDSGACESNQELRTDSEEDWQPMKIERSREYSGKQHKRVTRRG